MELETGNEKKLLDFVSGVKGKKIALISHTDLDGLTAAKITNKIINVDKIFFIDYIELNEDLIKKLRDSEFDRVIFTDIYIRDKAFIEKLEEFANILIIDHHLSPNWNSDKTVFLRAEGYSAGFMCYSLFSKIKNLDKLDWLVACSCIADYCHVKPKEWLEGVFKKYGDKLGSNGLYVRQSGRIWDLQNKISLALIYFKENKQKAYDSIGENFGDIGNLGKYSAEVQEEIDRLLANFENEKEEFDGGYVFDFDQKFSVGSLISSIISSYDIRKMFITIRHHEKFYTISARRQDGKIDCSAFLQRLLNGLDGSNAGGHFKAAGGHFMKEDFPEIRRRLGLSEKRKSL